MDVSGGCAAAPARRGGFRAGGGSRVPGGARGRRATRRTCPAPVGADVFAGGRLAPGAPRS